MSSLTKLLPVILITTFMLQIGLELTPRALRAELRCIGRLLRGLVLFLVIGPLAATLVAWLFRLDSVSTIALVLLSTVGIVPLAPRLARAARGSVTQALVLMFVLGALTIFTAVPTTRLLLGMRNEGLFDPARLIPQLALLQGVPLLFGFVIRSLVPRARSLARVVGWVNTVALVAFLALIVVPRIDLLAAPGWRGAAAIVTLSAIVAAAGYVIGGPGPSGRTLAALANAPNVSLALAIATRVGAPRAIIVMIVGTFLVRMLAGMVVQRIVAQRTGPPQGTAYATAEGVGR